MTVETVVVLLNSVQPTVLLYDVTVFTAYEVISGDILTEPENINQEKLWQYRIFEPPRGRTNNVVSMWFPEPTMWFNVVS